MRRLSASPPRALPTPAGTHREPPAKGCVWGGRHPFFWAMGGLNPCPPEGQPRQWKTSPPLILWQIFTAAVPAARRGLGRQPAFLLPALLFFFFWGGVSFPKKSESSHPEDTHAPPARRAAAPGPLLPAEPFGPFCKGAFFSRSSKLAETLNFKGCSICLFGFFPQLFQARKTLMSPLFHYYYDYY